jgi:hypothetical protein
MAGGGVWCPQVLRTSKCQLRGHGAAPGLPAKRAARPLEPSGRGRRPTAAILRRPFVLEVALEIFAEGTAHTALD